MALKAQPPNRTGKRVLSRKRRLLAKALALNARIRTRSILHTHFPARER